MTDELIVEGYSLDLIDSIPVPITFAIADVKNPSARKKSYSKEIIIPGTSNNNAFFTGAFSMSTTENGVNFDATAKASCQLVKRGIKVLDGVLKLNRVTILDGVVSYSCTVLSDSVDIFQLLSTIRVNELDWSDYNHILSRTNIKNSWTATPGTGYYYPLIERGLGRPGLLIWRTIDFVPYVYKYEVLQKCFELAGVAWDSSFLETSLFKSVLFGYGGGDIKTISPAVQNQMKIILDNGTLTYTRNYNLLPGGQNNGDTTIYNNFVPVNPFDDDYFSYTTTQDLLDQWDDGEVTIQKSGAYQMQVSIKLDYVVNYGTMTFEKIQNPVIKVFKNGLSWQNITTGSNFNTTDTGTWNFNVGNLFNFNAQSGDVITFRLVMPSVYVNTGGDPQAVSVDITETAAIHIDMNSIDTTIGDGDTVDLSVFLPAMRCDEFLMGVVNQFNLYIGEPDKDGIVKVEPLSEYYQATSVFTDISKLVDQKKPITSRPAANEYAKNIIFSFKPATDYDAQRYLDKWSENYGDYNLTQSSYYAKGEQKTELPWGTVIPFEIAPAILVPRFIKVDNGTTKPNSGPPRVMIRNGQKTGSITLRDTDTTTSETVTQYPCVHHFDDWQDPDFDLNFKLVSEVYYGATVVTTSNCYSEYYSTFINEMTSPAGAIWNLSVYWNEIDVKNRDWSRLLMIDGALFRLNRINEFSADVQATTEIELVKVLKAKKGRRKKITSEKLGPILGLNGPIKSPPAAVGPDVNVIMSPPSNPGKFTQTLRG